MVSIRACCSPLLYMLVSLTGPDLFGRVLVYSRPWIRFELNGLNPFRSLRNDTSSR